MKVIMLPLSSLHIRYKSLCEKEQRFGNISPCQLWLACWIALYTKKSLLGEEMHAFRNEHKQGVLQVRPKWAASLVSHCPEQSWRTGPRRRQRCGRWGSSLPASQSSSHGGACHVLTAFIWSLWKPEDWLTSGREKTQWLAVSPALEALNALDQVVKHLLALDSFSQSCCATQNYRQKFDFCFLVILWAVLTNKRLLCPQDDQTSLSSSGSLTYILLNEPFVTALRYMIAEVSSRNQMASVEGACGQFLCNFRVALDKGKPKSCAISLKFIYLLLIHTKSPQGHLWCCFQKKK